MRQAGYILLLLWGVATVVFFLFYVIPGDPAQMMLGQRDDEEQRLAINSKYGFNLPLGTQYAYFLNDLSPVSIHHSKSGHISSLEPDKYTGLVWNVGDSWNAMLKWPYLRTSFQQRGASVSTLIAQVLPNTAILAGTSIFIAFIVGLLFGTISALFPNTIWDRSLATISTLGMSLPSFFSAILMAWLFGFVWSSWNGLDMTGSLFAIDDYGEGSYLALDHLILPAITLGVRPLAVITQLTRNSLLQTLDEGYIRTARAKGLGPLQVVWKHALRNALNPIITATSGWFAGMLAGAVFVEFIFGWNGLGKLLVDSLNTLDLPVVMGVVLTLSVIFVAINAAVDLIYKLIDPRIE